MNNFRKLITYKSLLWLISCTKNYKLKIFFVVFINTITTLSSIVIAIVSRTMIDTTINDSLSNLIKYGSILALLLLCQLISTNLILVKSQQLHESMRNSLQFSFLEKIYKVEWQDINNYQSGDLLTRINNDVTNIVNIWVAVFPNLIALLLQFILAFLVLMSFDSTLALFALLISPIAIIISFFIGQHLKKHQRQIQKSESIFRSFLTESIQHITLLKTFQYTSHNLKQIKQHQQNRYNLRMKKTRFSAGSNFILGLGYRFSFFIALVIGSYRLSLNTITFGTFNAFLQLVGQIQSPMEGLARIIPQTITSLASVERIMEFDSLNYEQYTQPINYQDDKPISINITNISFGYTKDTEVLKNISLHIKSGDTIALVGTSGEGKTTFIRILLSLIHPQSGKVTIQFENNQSLPFSSYTRKYFSYVPQGNSLFSGSIIDNLRVAKLEATPSEITKALDASCSSEFIEALPDGINTLIGERGIGLSEGQAQRISIARALLHNAPFLILDEATSALDAETEEELVSNLKHYYPNTTILAITHRNSIFRICDAVYKISSSNLVPIDIPKKD